MEKYCKNFAICLLIYLRNYINYTPVILETLIRLSYHFDQHSSVKSDCFVYCFGIITTSISY